MAVSKAQQNAVNKYMAANYDRINLTLPKGQKQILKDYTAARGESVNGFIGRVIAEALRGGETRLPPGTLETAQKAAAATGEEVADFLARAVEMQMQRDSAALRLGLDPRKEQNG